MEFKYKIKEEGTSLETQECFYAVCPPSSNEVIKIQSDQNGVTMILANRDGWIKLAKICVEMAYSAEKDPAFHIHRTSDFEISGDGSKDAIGFFVIKKDLEETNLKSRK